MSNASVACMQTMQLLESEREKKFSPVNSDIIISIIVNIDICRIAFTNMNRRARPYGKAVNFYSKHALSLATQPCKIHERLPQL
jgi:hypothetical protein